jgi:hypothetical protein
MTSNPDETITCPHETEEQWVDAMWRCLDTKMKSTERGRLPIPLLGNIAMP